MKDILRVLNMTFFAYHGLLPEEARLGQRFEIDVELGLSLAAAGSADDPALTVDYSRVYELVDAVVTGGTRFGLVEAVAEAVARAIGDTFKGVDSVLVRVRKPNPPVAGHFDGLEVEIERAFNRG